MACDECGGRKWHLDGCSKRGKAAGSQRPTPQQPRGSPIAWSTCTDCKGRGYHIVGASGRRRGRRVQCGTCHGYGRISRQK